MKHLNKLSYFRTGLITCLFLFFFLNMNAQVNSYLFTQASGTYTAITGGTVVATATDSVGAGSLDDVIYDLPAGTFPFTFTYDNIGYTGCKISTNGFLTFGATAPAASGSTTGYVPLSAVTAYTGAVSGLGRNLNSYFIPSNAAQTGELRYQALGSSPNRTFVIQYKNFKNASTGNTYGSVLNLQIRLSETTNAINFVYNCSGSFGSSPAQVGLRGANNTFPTNINNRSVVSGTNTWLTSVAGTANNSTCVFATAIMPPAGLTYTFSPALCPSPISLGITNVTQTSAQLTWASTGGGGTFKVEYGLTGFTPGTGTIISNAVSPQSISGLTASTGYSFYVQQNCGANGTSGNSGPYTFTSGGPGEDCSSAILITVKSSLASCGYTVVSSGVSQNGPNAVCSDATGNVADDDRWLKFVAPSTGNKLVITTTAGTNNDWTMQVWKACSGSPADVIKCADDDNGFMPQITLCQNEYVGGQTYYIRAWTYSQGASGTMNLCIYQDVPCPIPPTNDECNTAYEVTVNTSGNCPANATTYTTKDATSSGNTATCDASTNQRDVWFTFYTDVFGDMKITFTKITATNLKAQIYFDCNGGELYCWNPADGAAKVISGLNPNAYYSIRVWSDSAGAGTFSICMSDACSSPTATISGTQTICPSGTAQLYVDFTGSAPFTFSYTDGTTTTSVTTNNNPYSLLVSPTTNKTYSLLSMSDATCSGTVSGSAIITIATPPTVTLSAFTPICSNAGITSLSGGSPAGGTYSGTGVSGGSFNPTVGTQTITYTVNFGIGCNRSASQTYTVNTAPTVTLASFSPVCSNAGLVTLTGGSPSGGVYSGVNVSAGKFNPSAGDETITYTYTNASGCTNNASRLFVVNPAPLVAFSSLNSVCNTTPSFALTGGAPTGGTYIGTGVSAGAFNPATAGVGTFIITYSYTNSSGCSATDTSAITVAACTVCANPPTANAGNDLSSCGTTGVAVNGTRGGAATASTWSSTGSGSFSPNTAALAVTYTPSLADVATGSVKLIITTNDPDGSGPCLAAKDTMILTISSPINTPIISGSIGVCVPATAQVYSVSAQAGVTFTWTVPTNVTIVSGQGTNSISTNWASTATTGSVCVVASGACGTLPSVCLTVTKRTAIPTTPGVITGSNNGCPGDVKLYTIRKVATADLYKWTPPVGATIDGSSAPFITPDTMVNVTFSTSFPSGGDTLHVISINCIGNSMAERTLKINKLAPATPGGITGLTTGLCNLTNVVYSINAVTNAITYTWTTTVTGATINGSTSPVTTTSTSVILSFGAPVSGTLTVVANNNCGSSAVRSLNLSSLAPATPGVITGDATGLCNLIGEVYSIAAVANATSYTWSTAIAGVTINGNPSPYVTASTSVTLDFGVFTTGTLLVSASNTCGTSATRSLTLNSKPTTPGVITGATTVCVNTNGEPYSIAAVLNVTSYTWTPPTGATIATGQGTVAVTVNYGATTGIANLTVRANGGACGNSGNRALSISRNTCPRLENANSINEMMLSAYPNPAHELLNVLFNSATDATYKLSLTDVQGRVIMTKTIEALSGVNNYTLGLTKIPAGVYSLSMQSEMENGQLRIVIE